MKELKYIKELISIKSFSCEENEEIINYLIKKFTPYSKEIIKVKNFNDQKNNLLIGINTSLNNVENAIVLAGHIDTVTADETAYKTNPYTPVIINDKLYGLGVIDMKSFFGCILNNIQELQKLKTPIIVTITCDEETNFNGIKVVQECLKSRNITPIFTIVGEPTSSNICTSSKSCYEYCINVKGKSCHSSSPKDGINANYIIARLMLYIEELNYKYEDTSLSCNIVNGGERINIISNNANIYFDIRSKTQNNADNALKDINSKIKELEKLYTGCEIYITNTLSILPCEKRDSIIIDKLINKFNLLEKEFIGGCEAGYYQVLGGDAIILGCGDLSLAHKPNEYANIKEYLNYNNLLFNILKYIDNAI